MEQYQLTQDQVDELLVWIDSIPISRPKKNLARDFSDAVPVAEIMQHYFPRFIDIHNYPSANSVSQKLYNWKTLRQKAFKKICYNPSDEVLLAISSCRSGFVELLLSDLRKKIEYQISRRKSVPSHNGSYYPTTSTSEFHLPPLTSPYNQQQQQYMHHGGVAPNLPSIHHHSPHQNFHQPHSHHPLAAPVPKVAGGGYNNNPAFYNMQNTVIPQQQQQSSPLHHPLQNMRMHSNYDDFNGYPPSPHHFHHNLPRKSNAALMTSVQGSPNHEHVHEIQELRETIKLLQLKMNKMEQLMNIKDKRIAELSPSSNHNSGSGGHHHHHR